MTLPAVIIAPESRPRDKVDKLIQWCRDLDGTEIHVITMTKQEDEAFLAAHPVNSFYNLQAHSLRRAAMEFNGHPIIWMEVDSIPLKPGWAQTLTEEYRRLGKPYMLSSDSHPPGDLVGGIGVYGPNTAEEIPDTMEAHGWDLWMHLNIPQKIARTKFVQHKYGIYNAAGVDMVRRCSFPKDKSLIRDDAVIFHADPTQSLMRRSSTLRFAHSGCIGDAIAALPSIRQLGGGDLVMTQKGNKRIIRGPRYETVKPLLESAPYINSVTWEEEPQDIDYDFTDFRNLYKADQCIANIQANWIGIDNLNTSPWLSVSPDPRGAGRVIIARSPRYQNEAFHWRQFVRIHKDKLLFVGLPEEHDAFQRELGHSYSVEYAPTSNMLEMARLIAAAGCFCGNQSSPFWVAIGLGVKVIQETALHNPDSIIPRSNARYNVYGRDSLQFCDLPS